MEDTQIKKILLDEGYISKEDADASLKYAKSHNVSVMDYLYDKKIITKNILGQAIAEHFKVSFVDLNKEKIDEKILRFIPQLVATSKGVVVFRQDDKNVRQWHL